MTGAVKACNSVKTSDLNTNHVCFSEKYINKIPAGFKRSKTNNRFRTVVTWIYIYFSKLSTHKNSFNSSLILFLVRSCVTFLLWKHTLWDFLPPLIHALLIVIWLLSFIVLLPTISPSWKECYETQIWMQSTTNLVWYAWKLRLDSWPIHIMAASKLDICSPAF